MSDVPEIKTLRDAKGRILKGSTGNAGGQTPEQRQARDALNLWLCDAPQMDAGKAAYLALLAEKNPVIVKDYMDRVAGKAKEVIEMQGEGAAPEWLQHLTAQAVLALARGEKPE